eukprot:3975527-Prymnesium_polylepis.1
MRAPGTRVVFQVRRGDANARRQLARRGFELVRWTVSGEPRHATPTEPAVTRHAVEWWPAGARKSVRPGFVMDLDV